MSVKRDSATEPIYPPKKRAVLEHRKLYGIETENKLTNQNHGFWNDNTKTNVPGKEMDRYFQSTKSDASCQDMHQVSRETSPASENSPPDYQTPERVPLSSRNNLKLISKPLFPFNDNTSYHSGPSTQTNSGHSLSWDITASNQFEKQLGHSLFEKTAIPNLPEFAGKFINDDQDSYSVSASDGHKSDAQIERINTGTTNAVINNAQLSSSLFGHKVKVTNTEEVSVQKFDFSPKNSTKSLTLMTSLLPKLKTDVNTRAALPSITTITDRYRLELEQSGNHEISEKISVQNGVDSGLTSMMTHQNIDITGPKQEQAVCQAQSKEVSGQNMVVSDQNKVVSGQNMGVSDQNKVVSDQNKVVSDQNLVQCKICGLKFPTQNQLLFHSKEHRDIIRCWKCSEEFPSAERLNAHMKLEHKGEKPYKCETCSREFTQYNNLRRHQRVHRENMYKCKMCDREFNEEFYLKMHMGTHTGNRVYSCGVCRAEFQSNYDLKMHVKTHSPSLLHTCEVCGKSFSKACVLRQHKKCHSGQRPHKCTVCEKTFIHRHHLTMHMKSHTDDERKAAEINSPANVQTADSDQNLSSHEMNKENIKPGKLSTVSTESDFTTQKSLVTCNKNLTKQFLNIPLNSNSNENETVKIKPSKRQSRRKSTIQTPPQPVSFINVDSQKSETLTYHKTPNSIYSFHTSQNLTHTNNSLHPGIMSQLNASSLMPYGDLYKMYSDQMQVYMNNMYMMNYMSHNAMLTSVQGQGHFGFHGDLQTPFQEQNQLPGRIPVNLHMQKQSYPRMQTGSQGRNFNDQGQTSKGQGHSVTSHSQLASETQSLNGNSIGVSKESKNCNDVKKDCQDLPKSSLNDLEVVSKNDKVEVYVIKRPIDVGEISNKSRAGALVIDNSDCEEHEIAEQMIKMSAGLSNKFGNAGENIQSEYKVNEDEGFKKIKFVSDGEESMNMSEKGKERKLERLSVNGVIPVEKEASETKQGDDGHVRNVQNGIGKNISSSENLHNVQKYENTGISLSCMTSGILVKVGGHLQDEVEVKPVELTEKEHDDTLIKSSVDKDRKHNFERQVAIKVNCEVTKDIGEIMERRTGELYLENKTARNENFPIADENEVKRSKLSVSNVIDHQNNAELENISVSEVNVSNETDVEMTVDTVDCSKTEQCNQLNTVNAMAKDEIKVAVRHNKGYKRANDENGHGSYRSSVDGQRENETDYHDSENHAMDLRTNQRHVNEYTKISGQVGGLDENKRFLLDLKVNKKIEIQKGSYPARSASHYLKDQSLNLNFINSNQNFGRSGPCDRDVGALSNTFSENKEQKEIKINDKCGISAKESKRQERKGKSPLSPSKRVLQAMDLNQPRYDEIHNGNSNINTPTNDMQRQYKCEFGSQSFVHRHNQTQHKVSHDSKTFHENKMFHFSGAIQFANECKHT